MAYRLKTSDITPSASMPFKKGTFDLLMTELDNITAAIQAATGQTGGLILSGLIPTIAGSSWTFTSGLVLYQGQYYTVPATTITITGSNVAVFTIATANITNAWSDPVVFTDGNSYNVHENRTMTITAAASGGGTVDWNNLAYWNTPWIALTGNWFDSAYARISQGRLQFKGYAKLQTGQDYFAMATPSVFTLPNYYRFYQTNSRTIPVVAWGSLPVPPTLTSLSLTVFVYTNNEIGLAPAGMLGSIGGSPNYSTTRWDLSAANGILTIA